MEVQNNRAAKLDIKPVFGLGRERRWKSFQKIFEKSCAQHYPDHLLKDAKGRRDVKYRLLKSGKYDRGILIYQPGNGEVLSVKLFHVQKMNYFDGFLGEIVSLAQDSEARTVRIEASSEDVGMCRALRKSFFQEEEDGGSSSAIRSFVCRPQRAPEGKSGKRKREGNGARRTERKRGKEAQVDRCPIKRQYFNYIRDGSKTIEGRINSHPFNRWKEGMFVDFFCGKDSARCVVTAIREYSSFREMLQEEGVQTCLPNVQTLDAGAQIYDRIPRYPKKARKFGVLGIEIKRI